MACARTVAVVVPSPATSEVLLATSFTICAPMFSIGSLSSISLATVTPSLVINGEPNFLSSTTFLPRGPTVTLTALASASTPRVRPRDRRCLWPFPLISLAQNTEDLVFLQDEQILSIHLDLGARPL